MNCQECGNQLPADAKTCPNCGMNLQRMSQGTGQQAQKANRQPRAAGQQPQQQPQNPQGTGRRSQAAGQQPRGATQQPQTGPQNAQTGQSPGFRDLLSSVSIVGGIIYGAVSFAVSFVITTAFVFAEIEREASNIGVSGGDQVLATLSWFLYNAHTVAITPSWTDESVNLLETAYQNAGSSMSIPKIAYYIVPVALLFLLAYTLANRATSADVRPVEGAVAGASIALGYGIVAYFGGTAVFTVREAGQSIGPEMGSVFLMMCLVYPIAIGGVAGYLARR